MTSYEDSSPSGAGPPQGFNDENMVLQHDPAGLKREELVEIKSTLKRLELKKQQEIYQLKAKSLDVSRKLRESQGNSSSRRSKPYKSSPPPKLISPTSTWNLIRAEEKFPDEETTVLVYNPEEGNVIACDLATVIKTWSDGGNQWAIFTRLPSRIRERIDIYIQDDTECIQPNEPYRVQVCTKRQHVQPGFMLHATIYLKHLGFNNRMRIILGNIQWLFILRFSNTERPKEKRASSEHLLNEMASEFSNNDRPTVTHEQPVSVNVGA